MAVVYPLAGVCCLTAQIERNNIRGMPGLAEHTFIGTATFTKVVSGFTVDGISVGNGTVSNFVPAARGMVYTAATPTVQGGSARESHPGTRVWPPLMPELEPDWVCISASPADVALQAPVSTAPRPHPSTSTRASLASLQVRRRRPVRRCLRDTPDGGGCARNSRASDGPAPRQPPGAHAEPVTLHELHPADDRTEGRVDLVHLHSLLGSHGTGSLA